MRRAPWRDQAALHGIAQTSTSSARCGGAPRSLEQRNKELPRTRLEKLRRAQGRSHPARKKARLDGPPSSRASPTRSTQPVNARHQTTPRARSRGRAARARGSQGSSRRRGGPRARRARDAERRPGAAPRAARPSCRRCTTTSRRRRGEGRAKGGARAQHRTTTLDLLRHRLKNIRVEKQLDPALRLTGFAGAGRSGVHEPHHETAAQAHRRAASRGGTIPQSRPSRQRPARSR